MKYSLKVIAYAITFIFIQLSCSNPTSPPSPSREMPKTVKLKLIDVSCTEAFINVTASDTILPINITLNKDEKALYNFILTKTDTILIDTTLQAGKTYIYQTTTKIKGETENSDTLQVKTLELTSNNYTWQKYTFGNGASSTLYDAAIMNENNIWCVGVINFNDSSKNGFTAYNAIHWNGNEWELKQIQFYTFCGQSSVGSYPAKAIFALSDSMMIVGSASQLAYMNGEKQIKTECIPLTISINKIWGTSDNDFYVVGNSGSIAHYLNGQWGKIESGLNLNIHDINGFLNPFSGKNEILCVADDPYYLQKVQVISIKEDNTTELIDNTGLGIAISSVWFKPGVQYFIVGNGLYEKTYAETVRWIDINNNRTITQNYIVAIRGNGLNDIIVTGAFGEVIHFNGQQWKSFIDQTSLINGTYSSVAIKGNLVVAVGQDQNQGVILIGHHL